MSAKTHKKKVVRISTSESILIDFNSVLTMAFKPVTNRKRNELKSVYQINQYCSKRIKGTSKNQTVLQTLFQFSNKPESLSLQKNKNAW